ncbi:MAG: hypothetical protein U9N57_04350 [Pseudomonadota bacterium]|nr:hypothetical protein [Pseudomonadota bacterium]
MLLNNVLSLIKNFKSKTYQKTTDVLNVYIEQDGNSVIVRCDDNKFVFNVTGNASPSIECADFAVWLCLPIAMSEGRDLFVHGEGTAETILNAEKLSDIWASWLPRQYSMINVSFFSCRTSQPKTTLKRPLMCFSGGIDSTYSLITNDFGDKLPDLLTVQGMDYGVEDKSRFEAAIIKTNQLVSELGVNRVFVESNAYDIYKKYKIGGQLSHVFLLAAAGFMFSNSYESLYLAADHSYYQQFEVFPAGSTFASNRYFDSGDYQLITHGEDVTRAEKLTVIANHHSALRSISFCKNRRVRPENCGLCSKCLRTKYMFLASIGYIPEESFLNASVPTYKSLKFSKHKGLSDSYIKDTYKVAFRSKNLAKVPLIVEEFKRISGNKG